MKLANFCRDLWLSYLFFLFNGHLLTKDFMWLKWVNLTLKWMVFFLKVFWRRKVFALLFLSIYIYIYTHIKIDVSSVSNYFTWWIHYDTRSPWCFKWVLQTGHSFQISWLVQNNKILRFRFSSNFTRRFQFMVRERVEWLRATLVARWMLGVVFSMHGRAGAYVTSKWGRNDVQMACK